MFAVSRLHEPVVGAVGPGSLAEQAGFRFGDRIVTVEGDSVRSWEEFVVRLRKKIGQEVQIAIQRHEEGIKSLRVTIPKTEDSIPLDGLSNEWQLPVLGLRVASPRVAVLKAD